MLDVVACHALFAATQHYAMPTLLERKDIPSSSSSSSSSSCPSPPPSPASGDSVSGISQEVGKENGQDNEDGQLEPRTTMATDRSPDEESASQPMLSFEQGRHPIVEHLRAAPFRPNTCALMPNQRFWLVTGPNMAGKSTFLRQVAVAVVMAQAGLWVAGNLTMTLADRVFCRVGASDSLVAGQSTFMVEMQETATILRQASVDSLIVLDEIGRGTATWDGLSIAWAVVEHVHDNIRARTLFATHYHELNALAETHSQLCLRHMVVERDRNELVFQYLVGTGAANRSYGIEVAALAGVPSTVVKRARQLLARLEQGGAENTLVPNLFDHSAGGAHPERAGGIGNDHHSNYDDHDDYDDAESDHGAAIDLVALNVLSHLRAVDPDTLTAKEAYDLVYLLKGLME
ncbi:MAG: hypothetical protein K0U36_06980 [Alphaproteobacteria bacterium]|nr:hypothetical protein [Alphaproteobacteria bacterium]